MSNTIIQNAFTDHLATIQKLQELQPLIAQLGDKMRTCLQNGHKILLMGNGGSAADCQHIAAEIVGRYKRERKGLPAIALTTDSSILTSVGNDYGFNYVFSRQVEALCNAGDIVIGISTSGNSANVVAGMEAARAAQAYTIAMTGSSGGKLATFCDALIAVPSSDTPRIQEAHILIGHILCELAEVDSTESPA
jgi:D-sedoheptulose 7-phosphate isomerase